MLLLPSLPPQYRHNMAELREILAEANRQLAEPLVVTRWVAAAWADSCAVCGAGCGACCCGFRIANGAQLPLAPLQRAPG